MKVVIKKWGNSAAIRIPASIIESAHIGLEQSVDVREEKGRIIIEPIRPVAFDLENLLRGITPENQHDPVEFGSPAGKEWV